MFLVACVDKDAVDELALRACTLHVQDVRSTQRSDKVSGVLMYGAILSHFSMAELSRLVAPLPAAMESCLPFILTRMLHGLQKAMPSMQMLHWYSRQEA